MYSYVWRNRGAVSVLLVSEASAVVKPEVSPKGELTGRYTWAVRTDGGYASRSGDGVEAHEASAQSRAESTLTRAIDC